MNRTNVNNDCSLKGIHAVSPFLKKDSFKEKFVVCIVSLLRTPADRCMEEERLSVRESYNNCQKNGLV